MAPPRLSATRRSKMPPIGVSFLFTVLLIALSRLGTANAQTTTTNGDDCSSAVLTSATIKPAVDQWINANTRQRAEQTYGGHISDWNTSCVTDMTALFKLSSGFAEDLTGWDTSRVTSLAQMLETSSLFKGNVSTWDVSNVRTMNRIFQRSAGFDADITGVSQWKTSSLKNLGYAFAITVEYKGNLTGWDVSHVQDLDHTFAESRSFSGDVSSWNLTSVTQMDYLFHRSEQFQGRLSGWKTSSALQSMRYLFSDASEFYPRDENDNLALLDSWNTNHVTDMNFILQGTDGFNSDIVASWTTERLETMNLAFSKSKNLFGTKPSSWSTSKVQSFASLFVSSRNFTSPLVSSWDASRVTNMNGIFKFAHHFAADVSSWSTGSVKTMEEFAYESIDFDADISNWNVSRVTSMQSSFEGVINFPANLLQNWNVPKLFNVRHTFLDADFFVAENEPNPFPLCWDLDSGKASYQALQDATCTAPNIGFDCKCFDPILTAVVNTDCRDGYSPPPCIGEIPTIGGETDSASEDEVTDAPLESSATMQTHVSALVVLTLSVASPLFALI